MTRIADTAIDEGVIVTDEEVERLLCELNTEFSGDVSEGAINYAIRAVHKALYRERARPTPTAPTAGEVEQLWQTLQAHGRLMSSDGTWLQCGKAQFLAALQSNEGQS